MTALFRLLSTLALAIALASPAFAQKVRLVTTEGDIVVELDAAKAPRTVENFLRYVRDKHYDGTVFHRVIPTFMIQGGGFDAQMAERKTRAPIALEARNGLSNVRGSIAMARTAVPDSATGQFFINAVDNVFLDAANARDGHGYAVFGRVIEGLEVVDKIRVVPTGSRAGHSNVPIEAVVIRSARIEP